MWSGGDCLSKLSMRCAIIIYQVLSQKWQYLLQNQSNQTVIMICKSWYGKKQECKVLVNTYLKCRSCIYKMFLMKYSKWKGEITPSKKSYQTFVTICDSSYGNKTKNILLDTFNCYRREIFNLIQNTFIQDNDMISI